MPTAAWTMGVDGGWWRDEVGLAVSKPSSLQHTPWYTQTGNRECETKQFPAPPFLPGDVPVLGAGANLHYCAEDNSPPEYNK